VPEQPDVPAAEILRLCGTAFVALITEPLFLLADSAIIGHLGTDPLAALGIASALLGGLVSICVFLAYGTTATVARFAGAGREAEAITRGVDGIWLAAGIGVVTTAAALPLTPRLVGAFGAGPAVDALAQEYLRVAWWGAVPMLVLLAAVGTLRGLTDLRTPMLVAVGANLINIPANLVLVYGPGPAPRLGIAGSAWGSLLAQTAGTVVLLLAVVRRARAAGAPMRPGRTGIGAAVRTGIPLLIRTVLLRAVLVLMVWAAARLEPADLAAMQLALTLWSFLAYALDALGITAQTLIGNALGHGDGAATRALADRFVRWGAGFGVATGLILLAAAPVAGNLFTEDPAVRALMPAVLVIAALAQPLAGVVFALDGVLIGADDGRFLALAQALVLVTFVPALAWAVSGDHGVKALWLAFAIAFMGARGAVLWWRERTAAWLPLP